MNHMFFLVDLLIYSTIFHCITIIYYPNDHEATDLASWMRWRSEIPWWTLKRPWPCLPSRWRCGHDQVPFFSLQNLGKIWKDHERSNRFWWFLLFHVYELYELWHLESLVSSSFGEQRNIWLSLSMFFLSTCSWDHPISVHILCFPEPKIMLLGMFQTFAHESK